MDTPFQPYPAFMYHPTQGKVIVNDAAEEEALGPGWSPRLPSAETAATPAPSTPHDPLDDLPSRKTVADSLYTTKATQVIAEVEKATDLNILRLTRDVERDNPDHEGGRKTVMAALTARIKELAGDADAA